MSGRLQPPTEAPSLTDHIAEAMMADVRTDFALLAELAEAERQPDFNVHLPPSSNPCNKLTVPLVELHAFCSRQGPIGTVFSIDAMAYGDCGIRRVMLIPDSSIASLSEECIRQLANSLVAEYAERPRRLSAILAYGEHNRVIYCESTFAIRQHLSTPQTI